MRPYRIPGWHFWLFLGLLVTLFGAAGCTPVRAVPEPEPITPRMLTAPGAIVGASPANFSWSPAGAQLLYVAPLDGTATGQQVLWRYAAGTGATAMLLNPAEHADNIDVTSAQWSPQGDRLLLSGDEALWLLDLGRAN